jgi:hypothetical protein
MKKLNLNENFISRIWREPSYYDGLKTTDGLDVEVLEFGNPNSDSGADFKNARVKIGDKIYSGDIEIHKSLKDWNLHGHRKNERYNKVIMQVVFWRDENGTIPVSMKSRKIPTLILSEFLTKSIHEIWKEIINNPSSSFKLPCYPNNSVLDREFKRIWFKNLSLKRLEYRKNRIKQRINELENRTGEKFSKYHWEQVFFEFISEALGFSKNKNQFLKLSGLIDFSKIKNQKLNLPQVEAYLFGTAGFLFNLKYKDDYIDSLKTEWKIFRELFNPCRLQKSEWNFFRLRPSNFPSLRIAYASVLCYELVYKEFFKRVVLCFEKSKNAFNDISKLFLEIKLSEYWKTHYDFGKKRSLSAGSIGKDRVNDIITNVIFPFLYLYSEVFSKSELKTKILEVYNNTKGYNKNEITRVMEIQLFYIIKSISESQGIIHLHNFFCVKGNCKSCKIWRELYEIESVSDILRIILY